MSSLSYDGNMVPTMRASEAAVSTIADVVHRLRADCSKGLNAEHVERRREVHGLNEFEIKEDDPLWRKYINQVLCYVCVCGGRRRRERERLFVWCASFRDVVHPSLRFSSTTLSSCCSWRRPSSASVVSSLTTHFPSPW